MRAAPRMAVAASSARGTLALERCAELGPVMEATTMRYLALAADYDGTLAKDGRVARRTLAALKRVAASGRKLILVTGRELPQLLEIFPEIDLFDRVVAENGAVLYRPATRETEVLAQAPPQSLVDELRRRRIEPLAIGRSIVATLQPHAGRVLEAIQQLGLELQVIFNKGAVMVLPANVNKSSGLSAALAELGLSPHNVVAIGDAENDHAMLQLAEYSAAVANAVPTLREEADRTTAKAHGEGVVELIEDLLASDLATLPPGLQRRAILLGIRENEESVSIPPAGVNLLVAGSSGSGKSSLATGVLERLAAQGYQFCVIDPEGDYEDLPGAIVFGSAERAPSMPEIVSALAKPDANIVVNLVSLPLQDRPGFFVSLLPRLLEYRAKTGRPHWILVDETHHLLPTDWKPAPMLLPEQITSMIYVTVHPDSVARAVLSRVDVVAALGDAPAATIASFCVAVGDAYPAAPRHGTRAGQGAALAEAARAAVCVEDSAGPDRPASPSQKIRRRGAAAGTQLLFPRTATGAQLARAEPHPLHADRRWCGRRNLVASPATRATIRSGCARQSKTTRWRPSCARSSWMAACRRARVESGRGSRSRNTIPSRPGSLGRYRLEAVCRRRGSPLVGFFLRRDARLSDNQSDSVGVDCTSACFSCTQLLRACSARLTPAGRFFGQANLRVDS